MKIKVDGKTCPNCGNPGLELNYDNYTAHCPFCDYTGTLNIENDGIFMEVERRKTMTAENEQARKNFEAINEQERRNKAFEKELEEKNAQNKLKWAKIGVIVGLVVGVIVYILSRIPALAIVACAVTIPLFIPKMFGDNASLRHKIKLACGAILLGVVVFSGIQLTRLIDARKMIAIDMSSEECIGKKYTDVENILRSAGFKKIKATANDKTNIEKIDDIKTVDKVTIAGTADFRKGDEFSSTAPIEISYLDIPEDKEEFTIPYSASKYRGEDKDKVIAELRDLGFFNIEEKPDYDIGILDKEGAVKSISIDGEDNFKKDKWCKYTDNVVVTYFASKSDKEAAEHEGQILLPADVKSYIKRDYKEVESELRDLGFSNIDITQTSSVDGKYKSGAIVEFSIKDSITLKKGSWVEKTAAIKIVYYEPMSEEQEAAEHPDEAKLPEKLSKYKGENYTEVEKALKDAGFTNITLEQSSEKSILTKSGQVTSITIDDVADYDKGTWLNKDAKVVITYYVPESKEETPEDNEGKIAVPASSKDLVGEDYETVINQLKDAMFTNVSANRDTEKGLLKKSGKVTEVSINGETKFEKGALFNPDSEIIVTYYEPKSEADIAAEHPGEISVPESSGHYKGENYEVVQNSLIDAGFTNITVEEGESLKNEILHKKGDVSAITIAGQSSFSKGDWFAPDVPIRITYYTLEAEG